MGRVMPRMTVEVTDDQLKEIQDAARNDRVSPGEMASQMLNVGIGIRKTLQEVLNEVSEIRGNAGSGRLPRRSKPGAAGSAESSGDKP